MTDDTQLKFGTDGLIPVVTRDARTGEVLMLAYMNAESLRLTRETGRMHYYSRSRKSLWLKGETSGNFQTVKSIAADCDGDALLATVEQTGAACHTGAFSCFYEDGRTAPKIPGASVLQEVFDVITDRKANPKEGSYTNYLFDKGLDKILKKIGEESSEVIIAAKNKANGEVRYEMADLIYHMMVLMVESGLEWDDIFKELEGRR